MSQSPKVIAHRGSSKQAPENTMAAFELALAQGADGIEIDVQFTRDGKLIILHDEYIDRTSNGYGPVSSYTLEELRAFHFSAGFEEKYPQQPIPELHQLLTLLAQRDVLLNIELKNSIVPYPGLEEQVIAALKTYNMLEKTILSSFNHKSLYHVKELCPQLPTGLLYSAVLYDAAAYARYCKADAIHPYYISVAPDDYVKCAESGIAVNVWTVDDPEQMLACAQYGASGIITNCPDVCLAALKQA